MGRKLQKFHEQFRAENWRKVGCSARTCSRWKRITDGNKFRLVFSCCCCGCCSDWRFLCNFIIFQQVKFHISSSIAVCLLLANITFFIKSGTGRFMSRKQSAWRNKNRLFMIMIIHWKCIKIYISRGVVTCKCALITSKKI